MDKCVNKNDLISIIVPVYNMEQYMEKLELLMRDEDLRRKMSEQAIRRAKDFHIEKILQEWEEQLK